MLKARFENETHETIITEGEVRENDVYQDFCCQGFGWEVRIIFEDKQPQYNSIWGRCENLSCPKFEPGIGPSDPYRGVGYIDLEDFEEWLAENEVSREAVTV